jgi:hypothetical protein
MLGHLVQFRYAKAPDVLPLTTSTSTELINAWMKSDRQDMHFDDFIKALNNVREEKSSAVLSLTILDNAAGHYIYCHINDDPKNCYNKNGVCYFCNKAKICMLVPMGAKMKPSRFDDAKSLNEFFQLTVLKNVQVWNNLHNRHHWDWEDRVLKAYNTIKEKYYCLLTMCSIYTMGLPKLLCSATGEQIDVSVNIDPTFWFAPQSEDLKDFREPWIYDGACDANSGQRHSIYHQVYDEKYKNPSVKYVEYHQVRNLKDSVLIRLAEKDIELLPDMITNVVRNPLAYIGKQYLSSDVYVDSAKNDKPISSLYPVAPFVVHTRPISLS